ncbi:MAG: hypothetical protein Q7U99_06010 [Rubrivivax sp.]|nr:hypothetical protein [Rubrivivax sp.]MDP3223362.1 hypothetical protein [Rubrivivax sp.]
MHVPSTPLSLASRADDLVVARPEGLYCPAGNFRIDPWLRPSATIIRAVDFQGIRHEVARCVGQAEPVAQREAR